MEPMGWPTACASLSVFWLTPALLPQHFAFSIQPESARPVSTPDDPPPRRAPKLAAETPKPLPWWPRRAALAPGDPHLLPVLELRTMPWKRQVRWPRRGAPGQRGGNLPRPP